MIVKISVVCLQPPDQPESPAGIGREHGAQPFYALTRMHGAAICDMNPDQATFLP